MSDFNSAINDYIKKIESALEKGDATEHTYRFALEELIKAIEPALKVTNEPKRAAWGSPDLLISQGTRHGPLTIGYIETKDVGKSLDEAEKSEQIKRYLAAQPNFILTDYLEFRWFLDQKHAGKARLGWPTPKYKIQIESEGFSETYRILKSFLSRSPRNVVGAKELAVRLASLTQIIRDIIIKAFKEENVSKNMQRLLQAFRQTLIPDLEGEDFADMFAQTLVYGLFAARQFVLIPIEFKRDEARHLIPRSNPFLRKFFDTVTGAELEDEPFAGMVEEVVQLLRLTDMGTVMEDFGVASGKKDPIFHFYETFLFAYNPKQRERRGVYYTPEPVVSYIVRSVDHILKSNFHMRDGLADSAKIINKNKSETHNILILDPACGTGTFLYHVIDHIRSQYKKSKNIGMWNDYVREHLLPRLFGFELIMAPYAIAHLKIGMELAGLDQLDLFRQKLSYQFKPNERINIFLTNTLEGAEQKIQNELYTLYFIADEANEAYRIKRELPIMVILGNPPYSGHSANKSWEMKNGKRVRTFIGELVDDYYYVDGEPLVERNPKWLQDDYVKFIRWAQWRIEQTGAGILAFITNHSYLENPTFRGMRQQLMKVFNKIYVLDLHGNTKKKERCPDGSKDQNVFDIQQGVSIGIFIKEPGISGDIKAIVYHADLWGLREVKNKMLFETEMATTKWKKLDPQYPYYFFVPKKTKFRAEYERGWKITEAMPVNSAGIVTARDDLTIEWSAKEVLETVKKFISLPIEEARSIYNLGDDTRDWKVSLAQEDLRLQPLSKDKIKNVLYRPFDVRYTYYTGRTRGFICMPRPEVVRHIMAGENINLLSCRQQAELGFRHILCSKIITECCAVSLKTREITSVFPLYLYPDPDKNGNLFSNGFEKHVNLNPDFIADLENRINLKFIPDCKGNLKKTLGPEDVFNYIYAVFHSPTYRERYKEFLKTDFPRVPITSDVKLFRALSLKGAELVSLHLLEFDKLRKNLPFITNYPIEGSHLVEKEHPRWVGPKEKVAYESKPLKKGRVYISKDNPQIWKKGQYFDGVPKEVWNFHIGGYKVCEKWLKDRRGRNLSLEDIMHYQKIVVAINETIRIMKEIDEIIPSWPIT